MATHPKLEGAPDTGNESFEGDYRPAIRASGLPTDTSNIRLEPLQVSWGYHTYSALDERDEYGSTPRLRTSVERARRSCVSAYRPTSWTSSARTAR